MPKVMRGFQIQPKTECYYRWEDVPPGVDAEWIQVDFRPIYGEEDYDCTWDDVYLVQTDGLGWLDEDGVVPEHPRSAHREVDTYEMNYRKGWRRDPDLHVGKYRVAWNYPNFKSRKRDKARERLKARRNVYYGGVSLEFILCQVVSTIISRLLR